VTPARSPEVAAGALLDEAGGPAAQPAAQLGTRQSARSERRLGIGLVLAAGTAFGLQNVLAKVAFDGGADVPTVLAVRFAVAAAAVLAVVRFRAARGRRPSVASIGTRHRLGIAALGLLFAAAAFFAYQALARLPAGTTTLLVYAYPALVVVWARLCFGEPITGRQLTALGLALGGCAVMVEPWSAGDGGAASGLDWLGVAFAAGAALANSWYSILAGPLARGLSGAGVAAGSVPLTAACFAAAWLVAGGPAGPISTAGWLACLAIGLLAGGAITAFLAGVPLIGPSRAATVATAEPVAAVALGALLLGEAVTGAMLLGGLGVVAAIVLLTAGAGGRHRRP